MNHLDLSSPIIRAYLSRGSCCRYRQAATLCLPYPTADSWARVSDGAYGNLQILKSCGGQPIGYPMLISEFNNMTIDSTTPIDVAKLQGKFATTSPEGERWKTPHSFQPVWLVERPSMHSSGVSAHPWSSRTTVQQYNRRRSFSQKSCKGPILFESQFGFFK